MEIASRGGLGSDPAPAAQELLEPPSVRPRLSRRLAPCAPRAALELPADRAVSPVPLKACPPPRPSSGPQSEVRPLRAALDRKQEWLILCAVARDLGVSASSRFWKSWQERFRKNPGGGGGNVLNRTIFEGDNLDVMRGMNDASISLIYADPPFQLQPGTTPRRSAARRPAPPSRTHGRFRMWMRRGTATSPKKDQAIYEVIRAAAPAAHGDGMKSYLIMMAVRLIEMRRLLNESGSIYLHCDPTADHWLRTLMDAVFGAARFRNQIV